MVNALLNAGADPTWEDGHFRTPLYYASSARVVYALLRTGAFDINNSLPMSDETLLHVLVDRVDTEGGVEAVMRLLEEDGIDVNFVTHKGNTPLHTVLLRYLKLQRDSEDDDVSIQEEGRALILALLKSAQVSHQTGHQARGGRDCLAYARRLSPGECEAFGSQVSGETYKTQVGALMLAVEVGAMSATKARSSFSSLSF